MKTATFFIPVAIVLSIFATLVIIFSQPVDRNNQEEIVFVVQEGEGISSIGKRLEDQGIIRIRLFFLFEVKRVGLEKKIQAGDFRLKKSETPSQIAQELTNGTLDIWVKIIEGLRAEEIAQILKDKIPTYDESWLLALRKNEGHLFPDTYLIPKNADIDLVLSIFTNNFDKKIKTLATVVGKNGLTVDQSIILASIVEREALFDEDRAIIAGILLNRLNIGMALQADATVQYALGYQVAEKDWWKKSLTRDDLAIRSPYNTYTRTGLPPAPIANPGFASLQAVFTPTETDYLYYLHDKTGKTHYAETLEGHNANIAQYL